MRHRKDVPSIQPPHPDALGFKQQAVVEPGPLLGLILVIVGLLWCADAEPH